MSRFWQKITEGGKGEWNLAILGVGAIVVALILTAVSIVIYQTGGAIQLDLSRPGYEPENMTDDDSEEEETWSATGELNEEAMNEFMMILDEETSRIEGEAFRPAPLSDESLGLEK